MSKVSESPTKDLKESEASSSISIDAGPTDLPYDPKSLRKADLFVLPIVIVIIFFASLGRKNIGNAVVAGLLKDLKITNYQYTMSLTVTYIPFILVNIPSNLIVKKFGANLVLSIMVVGWGFSSLMQGFIKNYSGLLACRFFIGLFTGGHLAVITVYLAEFYPRYSLQLRISFFFSISALAGAFSGLMAAAIAKLQGHGGRPGWAWIFILEGAIVSAFGVFVFFALPAGIPQARFLSSAEKDAMILALKQERVVARDAGEDEFRWRDVFITFRRPHVIIMGLAVFFGGAMEIGLSYFAPSIVLTLWHNPTRAQLMVVPPFAVACAVSVVSGYLSDKFHNRSVACIVFSIIATIGYSMFYATKSINARYASIFLSLTGTFCAAPALITWLANNIAPHTRRATAIAILGVMSSLGGVMSIWFLGYISKAPDYSEATIVFISFAIGELCCSVASLLYCSTQNKQRAQLRSTGTSEDASDKYGDESKHFVFSL